MKQREIKFRAIHKSEENGEGLMREVTIHPNSYKQHGYVKRKTEGHPFADSRGYVMEHRLIVEQEMKAFLPKHAIIHHKNGVRDDNRLENLEYMPEQERHAKEHDTGKRNSNGQFIAEDPIFNEIKFRLLNKNTGLTQIMTLGKLMNTTFRRSQFEFRGRFTGLKDKNGKEIFEGDVVKDYEWEKFGPREVRFGEQYIDASDYEQYSVGMVGFYLTNYLGSDDEYEGLVSSDCNHLEIIGNIYENPELVKEYGT